jgi:hypothetical protein
MLGSGYLQSHLAFAMNHQQPSQMSEQFMLTLLEEMFICFGVEKLNSTHFMRDVGNKFKESR